MIFSRRPHFALLGAAVFLFGFPAAASASITFGELTNFDVFNDTGEDCHGFEIELDGISSQNVVYEFGQQRYGNPVVVDFAGGVYVRYESAFDAGAQAFLQATPQAPAVITPTNGHACWTGGSVDYLTSGCEHFGVSLTASPTNTVYRWLVADPANPGTLKVSGTSVNIPAPVWNVTPPPPQLPDQIHPVVAAVIEPPEPLGFQFGDAIWMKVFVTESPDPAELDHLVSDDPRVPDEAAEVETEWQLLQSEVGVPHEAEASKQIGEGNESVTRRYEFYAYTGEYDAESHEAKPVSDGNPAAGDLGNYLGAQMAAVNVGAVVSPTTTTTTTTTSSSSTSSTVPVAICGDANDDTHINAGDALVALHAAVGSVVCALDRCDVDHSGSVTASDALRILKAAVGQPIVLDCVP
ncbi:MAG TPA: PEP-CTERM sorting domain-containing protein [Candidatus Binatia bacterium]